MARPPQAGKRTRDGAAAVRRARLAERSGACGRRRLWRLSSVTLRNTSTVVVFYFGLSVIVGMLLLKVIPRGRDWRSDNRLNGAFGPAHRVVLNALGGLLARAEVHGARIPMTLPGRALHAAAARH
jgi:hypothetical protein